MAKVEIDETELRQYQAVTAAVQKAWTNPKHREKLLEIHAEQHPEAPHPETSFRGALEQFKTEIVGELNKFREETLKEKTDREERENRSRLEERWAKGRGVAREQGYTAEGLEKLEKFMEEEGIANHAHAIPAFEKLNPPAQPVTSGGQRWDFFGAKETRPPDLNALLEGNEDAFLGQAIPDALNAVRNR